MKYKYAYICIYIYCMRFANPAEATGGSVGERLGAVRICKGCLEVLGGSWKALGVLGCPVGVLGGPWAQV